ncbi:hypothetical protein ACPCZR_24680 [Bacillus bombysepticus]
MDISNQLENKILELNALISKIDTEDVLGMIATEFQMIVPEDDITVFETTSLLSPFKQYIYLCNLLFSIPQLKVLSYESEDFPSIYKEIKEKLNEIVNIYGLIFFPESNEQISEEWIQKRELCMPVFMNYFNIHSLNSEEQLKDRIVSWFSQYNDYYLSQIQLTVEDLIAIYDLLKSRLIQDFKKTKKFFDKMNEIRKFTFSLMESKGLEFDEAIGISRQKYGDAVDLNDFEKSLNEQLFIVKKSDLSSLYDRSKVEKFLSLFSLEREKREVTYYTQKGPFEQKPIWKKSEELFFVPIYKQILEAIYNLLSNIIETSTVKGSFYRNRDKKTENKTIDLFKMLFRDRASYYSTVFETTDAQNEHDLLIIKENNIYIVEVKASKFKEPFRDPDRAFTRIKRDFKSDGGIQKAFEQGLNLKNLILSQPNTILYDEHGNEVVNITSDKVENIYIICATAENFGVIASNLSYLLEKEIDEHFPISINTFDLELIIDFINYKGLDEAVFDDYLNFRRTYHSKILATDELDIFGYFFSGSKIDESADLIQIDPNYAGIFDEMYFEKNGMIKKIESKGSNTIKKKVNGCSNKRGKKQRRKTSKASRMKNRKK